MSKISQNGTMYQMLTALSERLAKAEEALGRRSESMNAPGSGYGRRLSANVNIPRQNSAGAIAGEAKTTKKARERAAETTLPR